MYLYVSVFVSTNCWPICRYLYIMLGHILSIYRIYRISHSLECHIWPLVWYVSHISLHSKKNDTKRAEMVWNVYKWFYCFWSDIYCSQPKTNSFAQLVFSRMKITIISWYHICICISKWCYSGEFSHLATGVNARVSWPILGKTPCRVQPANRKKGNASKVWYFSYQRNLSFIISLI